MTDKNENERIECSECGKKITVTEHDFVHVSTFENVMNENVMLWKAADLFMGRTDETDKGKVEREIVKNILSAYAANHGYGFTDHAGGVIDRLIVNHQKHGKYYCPCRRVVEGKDNADIICPCVYVHDDIAKKGTCHCFLFKKEIIDKTKLVEKIKK